MEARHSRTRPNVFPDGRAGAVRHHGALRSARRGAQPYPYVSPHLIWQVMMPVTAS